MKRDEIRKQLAAAIAGIAAGQVKKTVGRSWPLGMHEVEISDEVRRQIQEGKEGRS